jgi:pimeloyl-ACP methyl ester carboxylesterase
MSTDKELVILLHGILDGGYKMNGMERRMQAEGYDTLNISYPSTRMCLEDLTEFLHEKLSASEKFNSAAKVHFVGHSMGGLLTRYYVHKYRPQNLGRVVTAGTPHKGSAFADMLNEHPALRPFFEKICGPAGAQLREAHEHDPEMVIDYELGCIAGSDWLNPLAPFVLTGDHDGTVTVESTRIDGMKDHIVVKANHPFMMSFQTVQDQAAHFIKHGAFQNP